MINIIPLLLLIVIVLFIPTLIVTLWKRKPKTALALATFILFLTVTLPGLIATFQAMMTYGSGDPQLMAGGISRAIMLGAIGLMVGLPILAFIQWFARRKYKRRLAEQNNPDIFT